MNDEGKIKALCAVIEELLDLIQDETTADAFREDYQEVVSYDDNKTKAIQEGKVNGKIQAER